jgi:hypothetical protein
MSSGLPTPLGGGPRTRGTHLCARPRRCVSTTAGLQARTIPCDEAPAVAASRRGRKASTTSQLWACTARRERPSSGAAFVVVMQTADVGDWDDGPTGWRLGNPTDRSVLVQREVSAPLVIVGELALQVPAQRALVPHDDVIEALAPEGTDQSFNERILPGRTRCRPPRRRCPSAARYAEEAVRRSRHDPE